MGHGSAHVNDDEEDDSPVEEVSPVKPKKPSRRAARAKKNDPTEPPKERTVEEEIALCQAWCDVSENNIVGNRKDEGATRFLYTVKNRELDIREAERQEAAELKREKLVIQRQTFELAEREKQDKDILFYNSEIGSYLPAIQQQKLHEMKTKSRSDITEIISRLVSRPKGVCAGSASGNGDRFADDRGDIGEYTDEGNRHVVRPRGIHGGRGGCSWQAIALMKLVETHIMNHNTHKDFEILLVSLKNFIRSINVYHKASRDLPFDWIKSVFLPENKRGFKLSYPDVRIKSMIAIL
ncbi:hypothetical protein Tco_1151586 [Tanacetum coccineum]